MQDIRPHIETIKAGVNEVIECQQYALNQLQVKLLINKKGLYLETRSKEGSLYETDLITYGLSVFCRWHGACW